MGQHEQVAESVNASNHEHLLGVEAGEVQTHGHMAAAPEAGHNLISGASAQIHRHDPRARGGKHLPRRPAHPARGTGHDHAPAPEPRPQTPDPKP